MSATKRKIPTTKSKPARARTGGAPKKAKGGEKVVKALGKIPTEIPTLSRWVADDPKPRLEEVKGLLAKVGRDRFMKLQDPVRIAVAWAWDEDPEAFYKLMQGWLNSEN